MNRFDALLAILCNLGDVLKSAFYLTAVIFGLIRVLNGAIRSMFSIIYALKCCGFFKSHPADFPSKRMLSLYRYGILRCISLRCIKMYKLRRHQHRKQQGQNETTFVLASRVQDSVVVSRVFESKISRFLHLCVRSVFIAGIVFIYRGIIRPSLAGSCRFHPTCSAYAIQALRQHGLFSAVILMAWRIIRCNPWGQCGHDPVPSSLFSSS